MNKGLFSFFSLFIALFVGAFYYSNHIQTPMLSALNSIKITFHDSTSYVLSAFEKHLYQAQKIATLEENLQKYKKNHLIMQQLAQEIQDLFLENNSTLKTDPKVELVRTISYEKFGNLNRVWIEAEEYNSSKIYGLTYKELVAGIVVPKGGRALGLLNKDAKSTYAVYLGKGNAPGIAHGNNAQNIIVKFIPTWFKITEGDEVQTSGLDKIFFKGLKVGRVVSVTSSQGYQNAIVKPYYESNDPNYFHMIKSVR